MTTVGRLKNGDLMLSGQVDERLPAITNGLLAHYPFDSTEKSNETLFIAYAQNYTFETVDGIWNSDETVRIFDYSRSWNLSVWDKYANNWAEGIDFHGAKLVAGSHAYYDVYNSDYGIGELNTQAIAFVNSINSLITIDLRYIVVIAGSHASEHNFTNNQSMKDAIILCGGKASNLSWTARTPYICVGEVGCGEGNAQVEEVANIDINNARAEFTLFSTPSINQQSNRIRYIRNYVSGSTSNTGNHWVELKALSNGINIAYGKPVSGSSTPASPEVFTDGNIATTPYASVSGIDQYLQVDLLGVYSLDTINIWHYYADARTYHNVKTEVSLDGVNWYILFDSNVNGEYVETSSGKIHKLPKNTFGNGLPLSEANSNIITNTDLDIGWSKAYCAGIRWNDCLPPEGIDSPVVSFYDSDDTMGYWYCYGDYAPQIPNTVYTISIYVKTVDPNFNIHAYTADNSEVGRVATANIYVPNDGEWHRVIWDPILNPANSTSDSLSFIFYYGENQGEGQRTWLCAPKMEIGYHATPFTSNIINQKSLTQINFTRQEECTIVGSFYPYSALLNDSSYLETVNSASLIGIHDTLKNGNAYLRYYLSGTTSMPYLDPDSYYGTAHKHAAYEIVKDKEVFYIIRKIGTQLKIKLYQLGQLLPEHISTVPIDAGIDRIDFGSTTLWEGTHRNIAIYNRSLSDIEINKLINPMLNITKDILLSKNFSEYSLEFRGDTSAIKYAFSDKNLINPEFIGFTGNGINENSGFSNQSITCRNVNNTGNYIVYSPVVDIDPNKCYQFSVWYRATQKLAGRVYLGLSTYNSSSASIGNIDTAGASSTNGYFFYSEDLATNPASGDLHFNQWVQYRGYLLPDSYRTSGVDISYLLGNWVTEQIKETTVRFMTTDTTKVLIRFLDYYNNGQQSLAHFALPVIAELDSLYMHKNIGTFSTRLLEDYI